MFKDVFLQILQDRQITPYKVAKCTGISQGLMSEYANGKRTPSTKNLTKIANFLDVPVDALLSLDILDIDEHSDDLSKSALDSLSKRDRDMLDGIINNYIKMSNSDKKLLFDIADVILSRREEK